MKNIQRHVKWSTIHPPESGPLAAARAEKPAQVPIALPRSDSSKVAPMIASEQGISSAAPTPWIARATISWVTFGEKPHHNEAAAKITTPLTNIRRRPKRSPAAPPVKRNAERQSVYAL